MCFGVYNLPAPVGFSYTIINNIVIQSEAKNLDYVMWVFSGSFASLWMTDWKVTAFFLNAVAFFKNAVMFFKKTVVFYVVYDVCRKYPVYHTSLFIVDLQLVFPVYEMQVIIGNLLYILARV